MSDCLMAHTFWMANTNRYSRNYAIRSNNVVQSRNVILYSKLLIRRSKMLSTFLSFILFSFFLRIFFT